MVGHNEVNEDTSIGVLTSPSNHHHTNTKSRGDHHAENTTQNTTETT
jgi:hypothetical protein